MYAKIFEKIFDSSIANDWQVRLVFQDMLVLSDRAGIVNRTPDAISRRTCVPLEIVLRAIAVLEAPDPESESPEEDGRRIVRIDAHRSWGWQIVNKEKYREMKSLDDERAKTRARVERHRAKRKEGAIPHETAQGAPLQPLQSVTVTVGNGRKRHTDTDTKTESKPLSESSASPGADVRPADKPPRKKAGALPLDDIRFHHFRAAVDAWNAYCLPIRRNPGKSQVTERSYERLFPLYCKAIAAVQKEIPDFDLVEAIHRGGQQQRLASEGWYNFASYFFKHDTTHKCSQVWNYAYRGANDAPVATQTGAKVMPVFSA
jgi:hypothetical protein